MKFISLFDSLSQVDLFLVLTVVFLLIPMVGKEKQYKYPTVIVFKE